MNDKDSKLIYEGWRSVVSKKWDQNHGARERGFSDHEAEQKHLDAEAADKAAAEKYGLDVEDYLKVKAHSEYSGESIEALLTQRKADQEAEAADKLEGERKSAAWRHEQRLERGPDGQNHYQRHGLKPYQDEKGIWTSRSKDHRETGNYRDNPNDLEGRAWD